MSGFHKRPKSPNPFGLSNREWEVMRAVCAGHDSSKKLARHLGLSERTTRSHLSTIHGKMQCESTLACVLKIIATDEARMACFPDLAAAADQQLLMARRVVYAVQDALPVLNNWADAYREFAQGLQR